MRDGQIDHQLLNHVTDLITRLPKSEYPSLKKIKYYQSCDAERVLN